MKKMILMSVSTLILAMGFTSCKKDKDNNAEPNSFKVRMTDGPGDYFALNLQITSVDVFHEGNGWINLSSQTQSMNVLSLTNGSEMEIASKTNLTAGTYTKLRVTFATEATIQLVGGGSSLTLDWTGGTKQVEIVINQQVNASTGADLLIDFNVAQSISQVGLLYYINPMITVIKDENTGAKGKVVGSANASVQFSNGSKTYSTYVNGQGNFLLRGIEPGTYTASISASGSAQTHEENNIVVTEGQITNMGNINL
jgi:hypothetical protein